MAWVARLGVVWARVTPRHFAWQAWHNLTSTFVSRGRRGTDSHPPWFRVAGVALMALGGALGCGLGARDAAAFCVAGVAQPYIHLRFTWQAWHKLASTIVSRGRRGTHGIGWRAWVWFGRAWRRGILRGRRGTTLHPPSFHVAGVAQTRIHLRFAWQAWHSWHWVARLGVVWARVTPRHFARQAWRNLTSTFVSRGRRGTNSHPPWFRVAGVALMALGGALGCGLGARDAAAFCVAGVAQPYIHLRFTWQAWHKLASTFVSRGKRGTHGIGWRAWVWFGRAWRRAILRGRRGTTLHPPSFHVAGVAPTRIYHRFAWQAWHSWHWVARLGVAWARVTGAGVAQPYIHLRFTWQAWQKLASTFVFRGRRGTHGIGWRAWVWFGRAWRRSILRGRRGTTLHPPSFHVAGVAQIRIHLGFAWQAWHSWHWVARLGVFWARHGVGRLGVVWARVTPRHFAWQAWHNLTSTFISRGRRGTNSHPPWFYVAGVALMALGGALGCGLGARDADSWPGTFARCHHRRICDCRTGAAVT